MVAPKEPLLVSISALGWPFVIVLALATAALIFNLVGSYGEKPGLWENWAKRLFLASIFGQALAFVLLLVKVNSGPYFVPPRGRVSACTWRPAPSCWRGLSAGCLLPWRGKS